MNVLTLTGRLVGTPKNGATQTGTPKTTFLVETDGGELPLRFNCISFGPCADKAAELADGDAVLITGKMAASAYNRAMTLVASNVEVLIQKEK